MLTRTAGVELANHNILVGVGPGAVATPINLSTMKNRLNKLELYSSGKNGAA